MKNSIKTKIILPLVLLAALITAFFGVVYYALNIQLAAISTTREQLNQLGTATREVFRAVQSNILTHDVAFAVRTASTSLEVRQLLDGLQGDNPETVRELSAGYTRYYVALVSITSLFMENRLAEAQTRLGELDRFYQEMNREIIRFQDQLSARHTRNVRNINIFTVVVFLTVVLAFGLQLHLSRRIIQPVTAMRSLMQAAEEGDLTVQGTVQSQDEIGRLTASFNSLIQKTGTLIGEISHTVQTLSTSSIELSNVSNELATGVADIGDKATAVAAAAEESSANTRSVASATSQTSGNLSLVASSSTELSNTISEIAANAEKARHISREAETQTGSISSRMQQLEQAAREIDKVTESITAISAQTNLLALNATIEAARAGASGKGFAVVANEIKELARQTAEATDDIRSKIEGMQTSTSSVTAGIQQIAGVITQIGEIVITIAAAIEEQAVTTRDIATNISQASDGVDDANQRINETATVAGDIACNIADISTTIHTISSGGAQVQNSAAQLSDLAEQLRALVTRFKISPVIEGP